MPLTALQRTVLTLLAAHRSPDSYAAGGAVINRDAQSPRFSSDLDFFHDAEELVRVYAERDAELLCRNGFSIEWLVQNPYLRQARIRKGEEILDIDWCNDSSFRFFPIQVDPEFGVCLHPLDLATNKMLALAGRSKIRDYLDVLYLHRTLLSLGGLCWAACGKDPGFNPVSLLEMAKRHVHHRNEDLAAENLTRPLNVVDLKQQWLQAADDAMVLFDRLPPEEIGCLYINDAGNAVTPDPASLDFGKLTRHFGSVGGAWPRLRKQA